MVSLERCPPFPGTTGTSVLPFVAIVPAAAAFAVETFTGMGIAAPILYAIAVLVAGRSFRPRDVAITSVAGIGLTAVACLLRPEGLFGAGLVQVLANLSAIGLTAGLVLRNQAADRALRAQATFLDVTHDAIFARDMKGTIIFWNRGAEELYGWSREEAVGKGCFELTRTVCPTPLPEITEALLRTGRWEGELVQRRRDGTQITVASRCSLRRDEYGRPVAILQTNNDITGRKSAEEALRRSEAYLAQAQTLTKTGSWAWSATAVREAIHSSDEHLRLFGFDPETGIPSFEAFSQRIHPDDRAKAVGAVESAIREGTGFDCVFRAVLPDGAIKHIQSVGHPVFDASGNLVEIVGTDMDVTERREAEETLRRSRAYLAEAQRVSHTGSFGWRIADGRLHWSEETYRIFGCDPAIEPSVELVLERTHPEDVARVKRTVKDGGNGWDVEHRLLLPDGTVKHVRMVAHPVRDKSGDLEFIGAVLDITETKRAEERLQRAQAELAHVARLTTLGEMTASIAHEVNQPLAAVVTNGEAGLRLLDRPVPDLDAVRDAVGGAIGSARRASETIRRVRALYKRTDPQKRMVKIDALIDEAVSLVRHELRSRGVALRQEFAPTLPEILGDPVQLQQVVVNLIVNGMDAMAAVEAGRRRLVVRARRDAADQILVDVEDSGSGIAPGDEERIFQAFFTTKPEGTGMGLPICRSIIERHGGRLWVSGNDRGPGATFRFALPLHQEAFA